MSKNKSLLAAVFVAAWLFLSLFPWQPWLENAAVFRFVLGLLLYFVPGALTFLLVSENKSLSPRILFGGLVTSIVVTGLFGVLGRLLQLNFTFIRWGFALWGVAVIILFVARGVKVSIRFEKLTWWEVPLILLAAGGAVYFASLAEPPLIHDDAFTYNALLYYYQHAARLDFQFPDSLDRLEIPRFWIAYWPLAEALISSLSGVDGLIVTGVYLPPAFACLSFLGIYTLGRTLGLPRAAAGLAILAQGFSLMRLTKWNQPGNLFFQRLTEDKVVAAFVISLILILLTVEYLEKPSSRKLIFVGVAALAMVFTHPIQFGMTCMILGVYGLPSLLDKNVRWKYVGLIAVLVAVVFIPYTFRFGGGEYSQTLSFSLKDVAQNDDFARFGVRRIDIIDGTQFYGISHYLTQGLPYEISIVAVALSLFFFWKHKSARYVLAAFLVLGVSMFPYTGWIVGTFTTPFQLWRLTWLLPFGLAAGFLVWAIFEWGQKIRFVENSKSWLQPAFYAAAFAVMLALVVYVRPWATNNLPSNNLDMVDIYSNYVRVGERMNAMDVNMPVIVGAPDVAVNGILPSITLKFSPVVFRVQGDGGQTKVWKSMVADEIPPADRLSEMREKHVEYLLVRGEPAWLPGFKEQYPDVFSLVFRDQKLSLYHLMP